MRKNTSETSHIEKKKKTLLNREKKLLIVMMTGLHYDEKIALQHFSRRLLKAKSSTSTNFHF